MDGWTNPALQSNCRFCGVRATEPCPHGPQSVQGESVAHVDNGYWLGVLATGETVAPRSNEQDSYCVVRSGWIGLFSNRRDGSRQMLRLVLPGEAFWLKAKGRDQAIQTAEALTPASCCWLSQAEIGVIRRSDVSYLTNYVAVLERELALTQDSLVNLGRRDAAAQVTQFLVSLAMRATGRDVLKTREPCRIPLTQRTIGEALGLTQVHVNRTIRHLRCEGILSYQRGVFVPLDPGKISELIGLTKDKRALWLGRPRAS